MSEMPWSLASAVMMKLVGPLLRKLNLYDGPNLRIRADVSVPAEADLDWVHLVIENLGSRWSPRSAANARIVVHIDGKPYELMWDTPYGPESSATISVRSKMFVSVVVRNCSDALKLFRVPAQAAGLTTPILPWICHVTDVSFQTQQDSSHSVAPGRHYLFSEVIYDGGQTVARFPEFVVPPRPQRPVSLSQR